MAGTLTRRGFLRLGASMAGAAGLAAALGACTSQEQERGLVMLSTQLRPAAEAQSFRDGVLTGFGRPVSFVPLDGGPFNDRLAAEAEAKKGTVAVVAAQQADFSGLAADKLIEDLSDRLHQLGDVPFNPELLKLAKLEGAGLAYIPWVQGTYLMAAHKTALRYLPSGVEPGRLTYEQLTAWSKAIFEATGRRALGFPAGEDGLLYRFFQGYAYPSFTGGVNTTFAGDDAVAMWTWLRDTWPYVNRQSLTYGFMQEPLRSGEVLVAWDNAARLKAALEAEPDAYTAFPAPRGPKGRGFMPVVVGLGIPKTAPDPDASFELITYLLKEETLARTVRSVGFLPPTRGGPPGDLPPALRQLAEAGRAQASDPDSILTLLPTGLKAKSRLYSKVFDDTFHQIIVGGADIQATLKEQASVLAGIVESTGAKCWAPDPKSEGPCPVR
jgi:multiple sugar transport system substrate-binding protein